MKKGILFFLVIINSVILNAQDYKLVWEDHFDKPQLNETHWTVVKSGEGGGNGELQYYRRENISVGREPETGADCLIITAKKEKYWNWNCTSGRLSTQNKITFKYGKVEARIKLPKTADGLWPAFWMLGKDYPKSIWPKCGEIDIMEMGSKKGIVAKAQDRYFSGACHWGEDFNGGSYPNKGKATINPYCLQDDFHLYTLIWDENFVRMYLDLDKYPEVKPYFEMPIVGNDEPNTTSHYFRKEFFIIFNLAVGGSFSQITDIDKVTALKSGEAKMYVDYIRIYQRGEKNEVFKQLIPPNMNIVKN